MIASRSYDRFEDTDLAHLAEVARQRRAAFVTRNPHHAGLEYRLLAVALCQGAALHYVNGTNGVKDFDVWSFYADDGVSPRYPVRVRHKADFTGARFQDSTRRIDLLGRTLRVPRETDPVQAVRDYFVERKSATARYLAQKAAVLLEPAERRGQIIWPGLQP